MSQQEYEEKLKTITNQLRGVPVGDVREILQAAAKHSGCGISYNIPHTFPMRCMACNRFLFAPADVFEYHHDRTEEYRAAGHDVEHIPTIEMVVNESPLCKPCFDLRTAGSLRVWSVQFVDLNGPCIHRTLNSALDEISTMIEECDGLLDTLLSDQWQLHIKTYVMTRTEVDALPEFNGY